MIGYIVLFFVSSVATNISPIKVRVNVSSVAYIEEDKLADMISKLADKIDSYSEYCIIIPETVCGPCRCKDDDRLLQRYYCDCQNLAPKRDCLDFYQHGFKVDGLYKVHQNKLKVIQVFCDQSTDGGGWTVIQRRRDGSVNFFRDWKSYKIGFGQLQNEFWLGNDNIFTMTLQALYPIGSELRIDLEDWEGEKRWAKYSDVQIGNENLQYQLNLKGYTGNAGDNGQGLSYHSAMNFSTYDVDNDKHPSDNCAALYKGGWWYNYCIFVSLNGRYYDYKEMGKTGTGIHWWSFHGYDTYSLKLSEMKIRRRK